MTADDTSQKCGCDLTGMAPPAIHLVDGHPDPADDTSREALIERVARLIHEAADYEVPVMPWDQQTDDWRAEVSSLATAVVDAVVMPLVQERDTYRDRWRQLMRDYEAEFNRAEFNRAENERLRFQAETAERDRQLAWRDMDKSRSRAVAAEAAHKALTEAVRELADAWEDDARPVAGRIVTDIRAILPDHGAGR